MENTVDKKEETGGNDNQHKSDWMNSSMNGTADPEQFLEKELLKIEIMCQQ